MSHRHIVHIVKCLNIKCNSFAFAFLNDDSCFSDNWIFKHFLLVYAGEIKVKECRNGVLLQHNTYASGTEYGYGYSGNTSQICLLCDLGDVKNEFHLLFCCHVYDYLRDVLHTETSSIYADFFWLDKYEKLELCFRKETFL